MQYELFKHASFGRLVGSACGIYHRDFARSEDSPATQTRATLAHLRDLAAAHPGDPAHTIAFAYALTDAGIGEAASESARLAMRSVPPSSFAFSAGGWVLHHNAIGVDYGKGYNYAESMEAYEKAIELNPEDLDVRESLANSLDMTKTAFAIRPKPI